MSRRETRSASTLPAALAALAALGVATLGGAMVLDRRERILVTSGTIDGLAVELLRARWIENQMDHGGSAFPMPSGMLPDLPDHETHQRLTVDLGFVNRSPRGRYLELRGFRLETDAGLDLPAAGGYAGDQELGPGQGFLNALSFDFPLDHDAGEIRLVWRDRGRELHMPIPPLPDHRHFEELLGREWPASFAALDRVGRPAKGLQLYAERYGCAACHGQPENPGSQTVGPALAGLSRRVGERPPGRAAAQHVYESLLRPNDHIAPACGPVGDPCEAPSAMPSYGDLLSREDMAHLVAYLLDEEV